jgi:hypothetical protein
VCVSASLSVAIGSRLPAFGHLQPRAECPVQPTGLEPGSPKTTLNRPRHTVPNVRFYPLAGTHLTYFYLEQLPVLAPDQFTGDDLAFVKNRVLELTYTSHSMRPWAEDLGYSGKPFGFDPEHRAQLCAELDAFFARKYGLPRDELCYILDPADVKGSDYPSETFRVLKNNEMARYGEYRTARLVPAAWDAQEVRLAAAQWSRLGPPIP